MTVTIPDDFDLQKIAASGQAFRIAQTPQGWRFLAGDKLLYLQPGSGDTYTASCTPEEWQGFWHRYFDLNRNYAAIRAAVPKQDAYLCAAARAGRASAFCARTPGRCWLPLSSASAKISRPFRLAWKRCVPGTVRRYCSRAGMCCMRSQRRRRSPRQGSRHCGTARWATAPRMFWLPPRQLQREHWTLPRWKPCPMPGCWKL